MSDMSSNLRNNYHKKMNDVANGTIDEDALHSPHNLQDLIHDLKPVEKVEKSIGLNNFDNFVTELTTKEVNRNAYFRD